MYEVMNDLYEFACWNSYQEFVNHKFADIYMDFANMFDGCAFE